jgi:hypothetical protein
MVVSAAFSSKAFNARLCRNAAGCARWAFVVLNQRTHRLHESRFLRPARSVARHQNPSARAFCREALGLRRDKSDSKKKDQGRLRMRFRDDTGRAREAGRHPQLSVDNEAVVPVGKIVRVEVTASTLFPAG